jgi:hypothetical protein
MYWALSRLWPRMRWHAAAVALCSGLPGFQQQPVSITFTSSGSSISFICSPWGV